MRPYDLAFVVPFFHLIYWVRFLTKKRQELLPTFAERDTPNQQRLRLFAWIQMPRAKTNDKLAFAL
jgi:hypothetical protein